MLYTANKATFAFHKVMRSCEVGEFNFLVWKFSRYYTPKITERIQNIKGVRFWRRVYNGIMTLRSIRCQSSVSYQGDLRNEEVQLSANKKMLLHLVWDHSPLLRQVDAHNDLKLPTISLFGLSNCQLLVAKPFRLQLLRPIIIVGTNSWLYYLNTIANSQEFALFKIAFQ